MKRPEILDKQVTNCLSTYGVTIGVVDWAEVIAYVGELEVMITQLHQVFGRELSDYADSRVVTDRDVHPGDLVMFEPARATDTIVVKGKVSLEKPSETPIPAAVLMDKSDREGDPDLN